MVENQFCKKIGKINNGKSPEKRGSREKKNALDATSHAVTSRLFASRAMAAAKTISIDVVSDIV